MDSQRFGFYSKYIHNLIVVIFLLGLSLEVAAQEVAKKRLPNDINLPTSSHICPSLSGDGMYIIFLSNYTNSGDYELKYSTRTGPESWEKPEFVGNLFKPTADHFGSYTISYDGKYLFFSSARANGIGRFDIWMSERKGKYWGEPKNLGKPLNSQGNEGDPSLSSDGRSLYFIRCDEMTLKSERGCKIYISRRRSENLWGEPEALPAPINVGNESAPHIMADNQTLIFSSDRTGGKGKKDLYLSRLEGNSWSDPVPLDFINTERNDEFVSVPAHGEIIYYDDKYKDQWNIYKAVIPEELRPKKVMMITGKVSFDGSNVENAALIQAFDLSTHQIVGTVKVDGDNPDFFMTLPEGALYDFSVFPLNSGLSYYSELYDLRIMNKPIWEKPDVKLRSLNPGVTMFLPAIRFENYTSTLKDESENELKRISAIMQKNPRMRFEVGAFIDKVNYDSLPGPDLTEIQVDTTFVTVMNDTTSQVDEFQTLDVETDTMTDSVSLTLSTQDSLLAAGFQVMDTTIENSIYYKLRYTYNNNRTQQQAQAVVDYLVSKGVPENRLVATGYGDHWMTDHAEEERNYWIELKVLPAR